VVRVAGDHDGHGRDRDDPIGVLRQGCGAALHRAQPATSPSTAPAGGNSQTVPPVSTPAGPADGLPVYWARDQVFVDLDSPWTW
jgi:hypothetical protein